MPQRAFRQGGLTSEEEKIRDWWAAVLQRSKAEALAQRPPRVQPEGIRMNPLPKHRSASWSELLWWSPLLALGIIIILPFYLLAGAEHYWRKWHGLKPYREKPDGSRTKK